MLAGDRWSEDETISGALDDLASRVESLHAVTVDTVVVGDRALTAKLRALLEACGEAMMNAAKHSGASVVSVYVEVADGIATVYVRDAGIGFEPDEVPHTRRGITESIEARLERAGGTVTIDSEPGRGTEVRLRMSA